MHLEFENDIVKDWDKYQHAPSHKVWEKLDWLPKRALKLQTTRTRTCIEVG